MKPLLLVLAALCSGCSAPRPFVRVPPPSPPFGTPTGDPSRTDDSFNRPSLAEPQIRRICRNDERPRGWVIIEYVAGHESCADGNWEPRYSGAVILWIADKPAGTRATICADQRVPDGWRRVGDDSDKACPGAAVEGGGPTSLVIQRGW